MQFAYMLFNLIRFASFHPILTFSTWTIAKKQIIITTSWNAAIWFQWNWMNLFLYLLRILFVSFSVCVCVCILDNGFEMAICFYHCGRIYFILHPHQFTSSNWISYFISMVCMVVYVYAQSISCAYMCVCRFHIINFKIGAQTDVSKIRSTGNTEQSSQNELLLRKRDADFVCVCVFLSDINLHTTYKWRGRERDRKRKVEEMNVNIVSNNFRDFPRRWIDVFQPLINFVYIW